MGHHTLHEIRALKLAEAIDEQFAPVEPHAFPKNATLILSSNEDDLYKLGDKLGLPTSTIQNTFAKVAKKLRVRVIVDRDGTTKATHVNDMALKKPIRLSP